MAFRPFTWFLLFFFLYHSVGYYFVFRFGLLESNKFVQETGMFREITVLSFDPFSPEYKRVVWLEKNEFSYKGMMYDVFNRTTDAQGIWYFHCRCDPAEAKWYAGLRAHFRELISDKEDHEEKPATGSTAVIKDFLKESSASAFPAGEGDVWFGFPYAFLDFPENETAFPPPKPARFPVSVSA